MTASYEIQARYLTLALDARRVIDVLLPFIETGRKSSDQELALRQVAESLQSAASVEALLTSLQTRLPTRTFEEIATVDEVAGPDGRDQLAEKLNRVATVSGDLEAQTKSAREAVQMFCRIESRALHRFNQQAISKAGVLPSL